MRRPIRTQRSRGFVLITALVFLLLMSVLALGASRYALLQQRMAGSLRNATQASLSAETALRGAEFRLWQFGATPGARLPCLVGQVSSDGCVVYRQPSAPYASGGSVTGFRSKSAWLDAPGIAYRGPLGHGYVDSDDEAGLAHDPRYVIEDLGRVRAPGAGVLHESGSSGPNQLAADRPVLHMYRITARGSGAAAQGIRIMQSTFDAPANP